MKSSNSALSFYFEMLFIDSIQTVKNNFVGNSTLLKNEYTYYKDHNCYIKEKMVEDDGKMPIFVTEIINKHDFFDRLLDLENTSILQIINANLSSKLSDQEKVIYLTKIYDELKILLSRALILEDTETLLIEDKIITIIENLKTRYPKIIAYHQVFKHLIKESDVTFFKNKDLKYSFYQDLYELAYIHYLIDDTEIEEADFIDAFISPNPMLLENKIRFSNNNYMVSYFLESLKPFFHGFTHTAIEKSKVFLNKQNKLIKSGDIYTSLSRGKNKKQNEKIKLDRDFKKLKEQFLK